MFTNEYVYYDFILYSWFLKDVLYNMLLKFIAFKKIFPLE